MVRQVLIAQPIVNTCCGGGGGGEGGGQHLCIIDRVSPSTSNGGRGGAHTMCFITPLMHNIPDIIARAAPFSTKKKSRILKSVIVVVPPSKASAEFAYAGVL